MCYGCIIFFLVFHKQGKKIEKATELPNIPNMVQNLVDIDVSQTSDIGLHLSPEEWLAKTMETIREKPGVPVSEMVVKSEPISASAKARVEWERLALKDDDDNSNKEFDDHDVLFRLNDKEMEKLLEWGCLMGLVNSKTPCVFVVV